ncbi:MAG: SPW repeat protein [Salinirussus sp.]
MATTEASTVPTTSDQLAEWSGWIAALVGLWMLVSPFVLTGQIGSGAPFWSTVIGGIIVAVLAGFAAYAIRSTVAIEPNAPAEWAGWIAALAGIWLLLSPFVLSGSIGTGVALWSTAIAGLVALVLAAFAAYELRTAA